MWTVDLINRYLAENRKGILPQRCEPLRCMFLVSPAGQMLVEDPLCC